MLVPFLVIFLNIDVVYNILVNNTVSGENYDSPSGNTHSGVYNGIRKKENI